MIDYKKKMMYKDMLDEVFYAVSLEDGFKPSFGSITDTDDIEQHAYIMEQLSLIHSEVSEAVEAYRRGLMDDHLSHRSGVEVELADAVIRIVKLCENWSGFDLAGAIVEKEAYNRTRSDHTAEARSKPGGKRF